MLANRKWSQEMPLTEDTKKKLAEILEPYSKEERVRILRMAAISHELERRKKDEHLQKERGVPSGNEVADQMKSNVEPPLSDGGNQEC